MTATAKTRPDFVDLTDGASFASGAAFEFLRTLRKEEPVFWHPAGQFPPFWAITRYADIIRIERESNVFVSGFGTDLYSDRNKPEPRAGVSLIFSDAPRHTRIRKLVNRGFTPRQVGRLEPRVHELINSMLDGVQARGECDFVAELAVTPPLAVICGMMGAPEEDWPEIIRWTNLSTGVEDPEFNAGGRSPLELKAEAVRAASAYYATMLEKRRRQPADDLVTVLCEAEVDGERLSDEEILVMCHLITAAGNETTRNAFTGGMLSLVQHPDQRQRLLNDPSLLPSAVEEILRWVSPVNYQARVVMGDVELGGMLIRDGDKVALWYCSANRDEEVFEDPYVFDVGRQPNEHLAFGIGEHFCLGASLARLELRVMLEETLRRLPDMELAGEAEPLHALQVHGIKRMPVRFSPRQRSV